MFETENDRERAGFLMRKFLAACDLAYRRSRKGSLPAWVAECIGGELAGGVNFKTVPVTLLGFSGESGTVIAGWEFGEGAAVLENRIWAALLRLRPLREFWTLGLRENHRIQLDRLLAETWVVDPTPIPPHGVIPRLGIRRWTDAPPQADDGRGLALYTESPQLSESGIVWGPDTSVEEWKAALERAGKAFSEGKVATLQALPDRPENAARMVIG